LEKLEDWERGRLGDGVTGRLGGWGRHLVNKGNLLDGNCNIEEKELKLENRDNAI